MFKPFTLGLFLFLAGAPLFAQEESLLNLLGEEEETEIVKNAFKSTRVINGHSMEMLRKGVLDFRILHRFGPVNGGAYNFFGLDQASMRLGFDYGISEHLSAGIGRSTSKKELDAFLKYRIKAQSTGAKPFPVSLVLVSGITRNGLQDPFPGIAVSATQRFGYYHELIIGRKFSESFSLQLAPILVHTNLVEDATTPNDLYALSFGGRYKLSKRIALTWDYAHALNRTPADWRLNPLSFGLDIETGGHVFQLHFSNATGMNERAYISDDNGDWTNGAVRFGFNLSRVFQLGGGSR